MKRPVNLTLLLLVFCLSSCNDDDKDAPYPSLVTEMADCPTNSDGTMTSITLDDDTRLVLTNPQTGLRANVIYRALAGFTVEDQKATLYSLTAAALLRDSTRTPRQDPTNVASLWRTRRYLNLHLLPKTQGGRQTWGYMVDSIRPGHTFLSLFHRQGNDPTAYTTDQYASLPLDSLPETDTLTLGIQTFEGRRQWTLVR